METAYTKSLEESVHSRLQLTSHEQEISHLKEICYKYVEEEKTYKDCSGIDNSDMKTTNNVEKMEFKIVRLFFVGTERERERGWERHGFKLWFYLFVF